MISAHGVGGGGDLPIPASFAVAGGTAALVVSFVVLLFAWRRPRYADAANSGVPAPPPLRLLVDHPATVLATRTFGLLILGYLVWVTIAGEDTLNNPVFGITYVLLWVGIVPLSLVFGPFFRAISPVRTLHLLICRVARIPPDVGILTLSPRLGLWPAALGLLSFVWMELVYPGGAYLGPLRLWLALYLVVTVLGGVLFGSRWIANTDPFEAYSTLLARLSPWGRRPDGALVIRSPLSNLATTPPQPGLVAVVAVLLGSTAFDSFSSSNYWVAFSQQTTLSVTLINTGLLAGASFIVGATFAAATTPVRRADPTRWQHPAMLAHSIVPIILGYMVAHYLLYFVEYGQLTLIQISDPLTTGANLFGTSDGQVSYWLSQQPTLLATIKVLAIVLGHVVGVVAAHDRSLQLLPPGRRTVGQLPLLGAMTLYTFAGLYLLFGL